VPSFRNWLKSPDEAPAAEGLAIQIARAGTAGISSEDLGRAVGVPAETLADLLRALITAGQVVMIRVGGRLRYRAAG
jgi:hypothetical protein